MWAASEGHLDVVRVLISEFKADVNVQDISGDHTSFKGPLNKAAWVGQLGCGQGANIRVQG